MQFQHTFKKSALGSQVVTINTDDLPESSIRYLIDYGLKQSLSDSYAGAKTPAEFESSLNKRLDAIKAGTMEIGSRTRTTDPVARHAKAIATEDVDKALKAKGLDVGKEKRRELIEARMAHPDVAAEAKRRAAADKKAASPDDILGDLLDGEGEDDPGLDHNGEPYADDDESDAAA